MQPNQVALMNKFAQKGELVGVVLSENRVGGPKTAAAKARSFLKRCQLRILGWKLADAWKSMQSRYASTYPELPDVPVVRVRNINDPLTLTSLAKWKADLLLVSGTNLLKEPIIEAYPGKILNLHTGLSPYVKGGPNCTNWCLANRQFHLVGNTIMLLDVGIDTGQILASEQVALTGQETLNELHWRVMESAHDLYLQVLSRWLEEGPTPSVRQDSLGQGVTYYTRDWTTGKAIQAQFNYWLHYRRYFLDRARFQFDSANLRLVGRARIESNR